MSKQSDSLSLDLLSRQKRLMKDVVKYDFNVMIFLLAVTSILLVSGLIYKDIKLLTAAGGLLCATIVYTCYFLRRLSIHSKVNKINAKGETQIEITCKKAIFLTNGLPIKYSKAGSRTNSFIICILFVDKNRKRYYYITNAFSTWAIRKAKSHLQNKKLFLSIYENTTIVKDFFFHSEKDVSEPYWLREYRTYN